MYCQQEWVLFRKKFAERQLLSMHCPLRKIEMQFEESLFNVFETTFDREWIAQLV